MKNRIYYIVECNDGSPVSDELGTLKEARKYIKEVKAEDRELAKWLKDYKRLLEQQPCEDCVSRQAVFDMATTIQTDDCSGNEILEVVDINDVKTLPYVTPKAKWIPVSERMPNPGEYNGDVDRYYLVQNEYGDMLVARYAKKGYWEQIFQIGEIKEKIVAWTPLPKPYKEGEK